MNPHEKSKLNSRQKDQLARKQDASQTQSATAEFNGPEDMLRYDAAQTEVPERLTERLRESIGKEPPPARPWWRKFFGNP
jgi:hypothetical protein